MLIENAEQQRIVAVLVIDKSINAIGPYQSSQGIKLNWTPSKKNSRIVVQRISRLQCKERAHVTSDARLHIGHAFSLILMNQANLLVN